MDWVQPGSSPPVALKSPTDISTPTGSSHTSSSRDRRGYEDHGPRELKKMLHRATTRLEAEALRASEAEQQLQKLTIHLKRVNDARLEALQDAMKAKEELKLYSAQLDAAQEEIYRAQEVLRVVDRQRYQAEKDAAHSRSAVRKLNQEITINAAREEGRRMGIREGLERGRNMGFQEARFMARSSGTEDDGSYDGGDFPDYIDNRRSRAIDSNEHIQPPEPSIRNPSPPPPPSEPVPVPPPEIISHIPDIQPRSIRNVSPSVRHSQVSIPPDGYIPALGADHIIRIPPPHELSRPPPTPERPPSPPLPEGGDIAQANGIPRPNAQKARHHSSPESNSTALSQFDMVNDPDYTTGRRSPLSVIHEVLSTNTSPNPDFNRAPQDLRHQSSWGGSSRRSVKVAETTPVPYPAASDIGRMTPASSVHQQGVYRRPRTTSSSTDSPSALNPPQEHRRRSAASVYTVPDINIQPPSRPASFRQESEVSAADYVKSADADRSEATSTRIIPAPNDQLPQGFVPTQGYSPAKSDVALPIPPPFPMSGEYHTAYSQASESGLDERPVIPDINLYGHDSEDDVVSSAISSVDTLTTPPPTRTRYSGLDTSSAAPSGHARSVNSTSSGHNKRSKPKKR